MCPTGSSILENGNKRAAPKSNLRSAFDVLDVDGDGKISRDDLRTFYGGLSGHGSSDEDAIGSMIWAADSNKDGFVEYDEFERVLLLNGGKGKNGRFDLMEDAFRAMDKDGDGKVGHEDLKSYLNRAGLEALDDDVSAMIKLAGGDENGGVTFEGLLKILAV